MQAKTIKLKSKKVRVDYAHRIGLGLFAKKAIKKDETIFIIKGVIVEHSYDEQISISKIPNAIGIAQEVWLDPYETNPWRYINHSCNPNAGIKGRFTVVAMRPIKKNEQIAIDYSMTEGDPYWHMICRCGNAACRKQIKAVRSLSPPVYLKYKAYIPKWLRRDYEKTKAEVNGTVNS